VAKYTEVISKNRNMDCEEALIKFYNSKIYDLLKQEDIKLWYKGPSYLYQSFELEQKEE